MIRTNKDKPFIKGIKFPIYPNEEQKVLLEKTFGCCRYVWNLSLAEAKKQYEEHIIFKEKNYTNAVIKPPITKFYFANLLPNYKSRSEHDFLSEVSYTVLQQTLINLASAYIDFFRKKKKHPRFKKKTNKQSFTLVGESFRFKDNNLYIAKSKDPLIIGYGRSGHLRSLPTKPTSATISKTITGKYYISFVCEYTPEKTSGTGEIGIDLGIKDFITTSNGDKVENPKFFKKYEINLRRKQQQLSRCQKESKRRNKARILVAKIHERIVNLRNDFQHKLSRRLINENQVIGLENLMIKNMVKNRKLSKAISQVSWRGFVDKLIYKSAESQHCNIVKIDTYFPSTHICNATHKRLEYKLKLSDRSWLCSYCGQIHDRDINAAKNIRDKAIFIIKEHKVSNTGALILSNSR